MLTLPGNRNVFLEETCKEYPFPYGRASYEASMSRKPRGLVKFVDPHIVVWAVDQHAV